MGLLTFSNSWKAILFLLVCSFFIGCKEKTGAKSAPKLDDKMNILFIVVDDLTKTLGTYGHPVVKTPNIDRLAQMGMQFNNAYCNYPVCNPSRSSFLTGLRPETTTILDNQKPIQSILGDKVTLPALFKQNGYYTANMGKVFHTPQEEHNDLKAWDEMHDFKMTDLGKQGESRNITNGALEWCHWRAAEGEDEDQKDGQIAIKASEFIKADRDQPFFLAVGFHKPHDPFIAPKKYFDMYPLDEMNPHEIPYGWEPPYEHTLPKETKVFNQFTDQDKKEFMRSYYACTTFMDAQVGKIMKALEESGKLENTMIVLFGDHGYHLGEHNWWNKVTLFDLATGAPFIMAGPSIGVTGVKTDAMLEFIDIYPTLAELFNLRNVPSYLEGRSFAKILQEPSSSFRQEVRAVVRRGNWLGKSVKNEKWRYIEWDNANKGVELYDQINDPLEYHNLSQNPQYEREMTRMKDLLYQID